MTWRLVTVAPVHYVGTGKFPLGLRAAGKCAQVLLARRATPPQRRGMCSASTTGSRSSASKVIRDARPFPQHDLRGGEGGLAPPAHQHFPFP